MFSIIPVFAITLFQGRPSTILTKLCRINKYLFLFQTTLYVHFVHMLYLNNSRVVGFTCITEFLVNVHDKDIGLFLCGFLTSCIPTISLVKFLV